MQIANTLKKNEKKEVEDHDGKVPKGRREIRGLSLNKEIKRKKGMAVIQIHQNVKFYTMEIAGYRRKMIEMIRKYFKTANLYSLSNENIINQNNRHSLHLLNKVLDIFQFWLNFGY